MLPLSKKKKRSWKMEQGSWKSFGIFFSQIAGSHVTSLQKWYKTSAKIVCSFPVRAEACNNPPGHTFHTVPGSKGVEKSWREVIRLGRLGKWAMVTKLPFSSVFSFKIQSPGRGLTGFGDRTWIQAQLGFWGHAGLKMGLQDGGDLTWKFTHKMTILAYSWHNHDDISTSWHGGKES